MTTDERNELKRLAENFKAIVPEACTSQEHGDVVRYAGIDKADAILSLIAEIERLEQVIDETAKLLDTQKSECDWKARKLREAIGQ